MGGLRDQLKKANLLSEKDSKRLAHEERVRHKEIGGAEASDREKAEHQRALADKRKARAEADRQRSSEAPPAGPAEAGPPDSEE